MGAPPNLPEGEEKHIEYSHLTPLSQLFLPSGRLGGGLLIASPPSCGGRESFFSSPSGRLGGALVQIDFICTHLHPT